MSLIYIQRKRVYKFVYEVIASKTPFNISEIVLQKDVTKILDYTYCNTVLNFLHSIHSTAILIHKAKRDLTLIRVKCQLALYYFLIFEVNDQRTRFVQNSYQKIVYKET